MVRGVPFIRDLLRCRRRDYAEAAKEVFGILVFAMLPFWLGASVISLIPKASVGSYISDFLISGEALLISAAIIGPSIYVITKQYGDLPKSLTIHFPQGWFLVLISLTICMITAAIFGLQRIYAQLTSNHKAPDLLFDSALMEKFSFSIVVITVIALYLVTVFRNFVENGASSEMRAGEDEFLKQWKKRR